MLNTVGRGITNLEPDVAAVMQQIIYDPGWRLPTLTDDHGALQPFTTEAMNVEGIAINFLRLLGRDSETGSVTLTQAFSLTTDSGSTLLHLSASLGFSKLLSDLVWRKLDPDRQDKNGNTPLHFSAFYGQHACAQILVENGADTKIANFRGLTPRKVALDFQHTVIVNLLDEDLPDFATPTMRDCAARSAPRLSLKEEGKEESASPALVPTPDNILVNSSGKFFIDDLCLSRILTRILETMQPQDGRRAQMPIVALNGYPEEAKPVAFSPTSAPNERTLRMRADSFFTEAPSPLACWVAAEEIHIKYMKRLRQYTSSRFHKEWCSEALLEDDSAGPLSLYSKPTVRLGLERSCPVAD